MAYENLSAGLLDYAPCRYGKSKLMFRGPRRPLDQPYIAYLGGSKTYGKFVPDPYVAQLERSVGLASVNLGCLNAGLDVFTADPAIAELCSGAEIAVVQVLGAQNMNNRFYRVHPRRNDRFVSASALLKTIYGEVDFTEYNFTGHLLTGLMTLSPERFEIVRRELRDAWVARMRMFLEKIGGKVLLLWLSDHSPDETNLMTEGLGRKPFFVDRQMINDIRPYVTEYEEVILPADAMAEDTAGMVFSPLEAPAAKKMIGLRGHELIAEQLGPVLQDLRNRKGPPKRRALLG